MEYRSPLFAGVILVLVNVFGASIGLENSTQVTPNSSEVIPVQLVKCRGASECVKIEDCKAKRRRGSRRFCKWVGKPTHMCCAQERVKSAEKTSRTRHPRSDSIYFDEEYNRQPSRFNNRYQDRSDEDESWERPWFGRRYFRNRFHHNHDYNEDFEGTDDEYSGQSFNNEDPECGVLQEEERGEIRALIIGGTPPLTAASNPWMVAIGQSMPSGEPQWFCGGALISRKIVITAAHCITKRKANLVRVGELDFKSNTEPAEPQESEIESSVTHPSYKQPQHYHDIAIIRLKTPVRYSKYVRPICLPPDNGNLYEEARVTLTGWGNVEYGGESTSILQEVHINVISNSRCNARYGDLAMIKSNTRTLPRGIINSQMCAGDENGGKDACQGDSGGPIVKREGRRRIVIGLVSSGLGCGSKMYPGIYTRVSDYSDWIRSFL